MTEFPQNILKKINAFTIRMIRKHKNIILGIIVIAILFYIIIRVIQQRIRSKELRITHGNQLLNAKSIDKNRAIFNIILDVRTSKEYQNGNVDESVNIDYKDILNSPDSKILNKHKIYKNHRILIYCKTGRRSGLVRNILINYYKYKPENIFITELNHKQLTDVFYGKNNEYTRNKSIYESFDDSDDETDDDEED